jgi:hypothetical protein
MFFLGHFVYSVLLIFGGDYPISVFVRGCEDLVKDVGLANFSRKQKQIVSAAALSFFFDNHSQKNSFFRGFC